MPMKINVGDRVSYPSVLVLGKAIIQSGIGKVVAVKADPYGKTSRQIAVISGQNGRKFEAFTSALQVIVERGGQK